MSLSLEQLVLVVEMIGTHSKVFDEVVGTLGFDEDAFFDKMETHYSKVCDNVFGDDEEKYVKQYLTWAVKEIMKDEMA